MTLLWTSTILRAILSRVWRSKQRGHARRPLCSPAPVLMPPKRYLREGDEQLDARTIVGLTEREAELVLDRHRCLMRVLERDGTRYDREDNDISHRIDVAIQSGIVVALLLDP